MKGAPKTSRETHEMTKAVPGEGTVSICHINEWFKRSKHEEQILKMVPSNPAAVIL